MARRVTLVHESQGNPLIHNNREGRLPRQSIPGGFLVCILPATAYYDHGNSIGSWYDLPVGAFSESGTRIPTEFCVARIG